MTDDENSDDNSDDDKISIPPKTPQSSAKNILLTAHSSDSADIPENDNLNDTDRTCCSLLENIDQRSNYKRATGIHKETPPLFSDSEKSNFNDEFLNNSRNYPLNERNNDDVEKTSMLADTVVGSFTDQDLIFSRLSDLKIQDNSPQKNQKSKTSILADTVVDDVEASDNDESSSEEEVISILDSDEDLDHFSGEPPLQKESSSFVNCSNVSSKTSLLPDSINTFFNNPPSVKSNEVAVSHTMIRNFRNNILDFDENLNEEETSFENRFVRENNAEDEDVVINESIEISETSGTDLEFNKKCTNDIPDNVEADIESPYESDKEYGAVVESEELSTGNSKIQSTQSDKKHRETLKIKARIKLEINFKIYHSNSSNSSNNNSNRSSSSSEPSPPKAPPRNNDLSSSARSSSKATPSNKTVQPPTKKTETPVLGKAGPSSANKPAASSAKELSTPINTKKSLRNQTPISAKPNTPVSSLKVPKSVTKSATKSSTKNPTNTPKVKLNLVEESSFITPLKDTDIEIDEGMEEMLNTLYGEEWKTPSLLQSCKSRKFQKAVRKSIALSNFGAFSRDLPKDLESTRISFPTEEKNAIISKKKTEIKVVSSPYFEKKQQTLNAKTVESEKKVGKTPKYHPVCDTDTEDSSSDSSGEDFQPNETWNASCSDDNTADDDNDFVIKKRTIKSNISRKPPVFEADPDTISKNKEKEFDELLDRFEYKKPQQIATPSSTLKTKRKLFTHIYDPDNNEPLEIVKDVVDKENNVKTPNIWNQPFPFQNKKLEQVKNIDSGISSLLTPSTPKTVVKKILKPSTVERTPKLKTASKIIDNFQKDRFTNFGFLKSLDVTLNKSLCHPEALLYRENFKLKKLELTEKLYKLYNDKVFDNRLEVPVSWNKKLTNTAGRCNNSRKSGDRQSTIDLSEKVLTSADRLRCTLIHEMCHAATWIINGENGHGATWKSYAAKAMRTFPELPKISTCHNYIIEYKYTYQCVKCNAKFNTHSKSKKVENIQCSLCHSKIELFLNKKNKEGVVVLTPVRKASGFAKFVQVKYKEIKTSNLTHAQVMQKLGSEFSGLSVEEKGQY
ncbi:unnamed protein product [Diamesa serratosioi]